ncbi:DinB family protein [Paeniglutamicibacter antarcticus]|uniref:DinB family protein n=1 Tax=Arthrobacter terrae TaxID=2935737 RepID=A0A931G972_9MICC|nr:DinB family protein [Arthrobacter terrae]MBG0738417.1 DinB family protein [Arthrobacter terrae]
MAEFERTMPPLNADERATLAGWLDFYRATLIRKCGNLDDEQLRHAAVEPSALTLLGLIQHLAEVERNWFRRVLTGEQIPPIYAPDAGTDGDDGHDGHDGGFDLTGTSFRDAVDSWQAEVTQARRNCAARALDATSPFMGAEVTLRWIYLHMLGEYARHCGHADLIRERVDGCTGV